MATQSKAKTKASDLIDSQLEQYRSMRDFTTTAEPRGDTTKDGSRKKAAAKMPFVIQKHAASHLHYDFRLGWNGVLKSWAVAKGPSLATKDKRLAVQVEDHPWEYAGFEGIIPEGQYGGGTVMLWDTGTWEPQPGHTAVDAGLRDGSLKFILHGNKLKGNWALIRMGGRAANASKPNWLLIKEHDAFERGDEDAAITDEAPNSAITGRSLEEIAAGKDHVWQSKPAAGNLPRADKQLSGAVPVRKKAPASAAKSDMQLDAYPTEAQPEFVAPQLASAASVPANAQGWIHEIKLDGYRVEARKSGSEMRLFTRSGLDWTHRMKEIASAVGKLDSDSATIDGEVVVLSEDGTTSFAELQAHLSEGAKHGLTYFAFDLLHLNGHNLRNAPLIERKEILTQLLQRSKGTQETIRLSEHLESEGKEVFRRACMLHAEGIVSKRASGKYISGRSNDWLKAKCSHEQEFVIGGYTLPSDGGDGIGALLIGYYDDGGRLVYAGRTGTGFNNKTRRFLRKQLDEMQAKANPFTGMSAAAGRGAVWVKPKLVAEVSFANWTADQLVRQASFKGLREDKAAKEVRREETIAASASRGGVAEIKRDAPPAMARTASASMSRLERRAESTKGTSRLTHPDKILDTESGMTKRQLYDYYSAVADHLLPYITDRPLSLVRCPDGSSSPCFFQKHPGAALPVGIETIPIADKKTGKLEPYLTLSSREAIEGLAQLGVLEVHAWGSRNDDLEHPDRVVIDLDPDDAISWATLGEAAQETRRLLKMLGLESFLKSTGGKGLHVVVPIEPKFDWGQIKQFSHAIALTLERMQPALYLTKMSKAARKGRIFVDYLRNERGATSIAAFSPRARAGATVALPLAWVELESAERPVFHVTEFDQWKDRLKRDPWKKLSQVKQTINMDKADRLLKLT